jgi:hypothetical protein
MATYSAIGQEPTEADPMSSSTGSLRGRRLGYTEMLWQEHGLTGIGAVVARKMLDSRATHRGYRV